MSYRDVQKRAGAPGFFWAPPDQVDGDIVTLTGEEARHAFTVCRLREGELITVCDGDGNAYDCEITSARSREVACKVVRAHRQLGEPLAHVTLAVGIGKPANFDWIVEKAVELGVARIVPIRAAQSPTGIGGPDAAKRRVTRWRRLALGAMKQSLRSRRPPVDEITGVADVAGMIREYHCAVLADPGGARLELKSHTGERITKPLLISGPEAGFTADERQQLTESGAVPFSLGTRRLRAETAAVAALTLLMHKLGEL